MPAERRRLTRGDIIDLKVYGEERVERRRAIIPKKKNSPHRGWAACDVLFRVLCNDVATGARDALHREGRG